MNYPIDFKRIAPDIKETLFNYVGIGSFSYTEHEREIEPFFMDLMATYPYFKEHPDHYGIYRIPGDPLDRGVCWAMVQGTGTDTVCMVHHYDVVGVEDFKALRDVALLPDELMERFKQNPSVLLAEAQEDLASGEYWFGKAVCDMKAGGSIQYTLLREYGNMALKGEFPGTVIVVGVPDEENLSAGMRGADLLLSEMMEEYGLTYHLMINSEPHQRQNPEAGMISLGTIGKMLPFVYARGSMSHVGKVFEGLNPVLMLSEIERRTELSMLFADVVETDTDTAECAPPPTWMYMKDSKQVYDVSMPVNAYGCISVLTLTSTPAELLAKLRTVCEESFAKVIEDANDSYHTFLKNSKRPVKDLPWKVLVSSFDELLAEAKRDYSETFVKQYDEKVQELLADFNDAKRNVIECNYKLLEFVYDFIDNVAPRVVYGLVPPYYPCVSNLEYEKEDPKIHDLFPYLQAYAKEKFDQPYSKEYFFTGLCDLSYVDMKDPEKVRQALTENMPLFGDFYDIPLEEISKISMPVINIGPWGKDFHKVSERVLIEDVMVRTPRILDAAVKYMLG